MVTQPGAHFALPAYLRHIGFAGTARPDIATLREVCRLHPMAIPFENLTVLAGRPVSLDIADLEAKLLGADGGGPRRGGYCYEQNHLLAHALEAIGFQVEGLAARVCWGVPPGVVTPQSHMALRVRVEGRDFIADAGFGSMTLTAPLEILPGAEQQTPHETWRLRAEDADLVAEARIGDEWRPVFRPGPERRFRPDYDIANYWVATHPDSPFTANLFVSRPYPGGRRTLFNLRLTEIREGAAPEHRELASAAEAEAMVRDVFGIDIPDREALRKTLAAIAEKSGAGGTELETRVLRALRPTWLKVARIVSEVSDDSHGLVSPEEVGTVIEMLAKTGDIDARGDVRNWRRSEIRLRPI